VKKKIFDDGNQSMYETENEDELLLKFSDDLVDNRGHVKASVKNKGAVAARLAVHLYKVMASYHFPVRFKSQKSEKELIVKKAELFPFYCAVTSNEDEETTAPQLDYVLIEESGKRTVEAHELIESEVVTSEQLAEIRRFVLKMNVVLKDFFQRRQLGLLGFRVQFGILPSGKIGLCSELTLDSCDIKDAGSRTKFTTSYIISHQDDAAELYETAQNKLLY